MLRNFTGGDFLEKKTKWNKNQIKYVAVHPGQKKRYFSFLAGLVDWKNFVSEYTYCIHYSSTTAWKLKKYCRDSWAFFLLYCESYLLFLNCKRLPPVLHGKNNKNILCQSRESNCSHVTDVLLVPLQFIFCSIFFFASSSSLYLFPLLTFPPFALSHSSCQNIPWTRKIFFHPCHFFLYFRLSFLPLIRLLVLTRSPISLSLFFSQRWVAGGHFRRILREKTRRNERKKERDQGRKCNPLR